MLYKFKFEDIFAFVRQKVADGNSYAYIRIFEDADFYWLLCNGGDWQQLDKKHPQWWIMDDLFEDYLESVYDELVPLTLDDDEWGGIEYKSSEDGTFYEMTIDIEEDRIVDWLVPFEKEE